MSITNTPAVKLRKHHLHKFNLSQVVMQNAQKENCSAQIRRAFEREHQRQFLGLFQKVLSSHEAFLEAPGPEHDNRARESGEKALDEVTILSCGYTKTRECESHLTTISGNFS